VNGASPSDRNPVIHFFLRTYPALRMLNIRIIFYIAAGMYCLLEIPSASPERGTRPI